MNSQEFDHFVAIVGDLSLDGKTVNEAKVRLLDEGLTEKEANLTIRAFMEQRE